MEVLAIFPRDLRMVAGRNRPFKECPSRATLEAFLARTLDDAAAPGMVLHLGQCDVCRDVVVPRTPPPMVEPRGGLVRNTLAATCLSAMMIGAGFHLSDVGPVRGAVPVNVPVSSAPSLPVEATAGSDAAIAMQPDFPAEVQPLEFNDTGVTGTALPLKRNPVSEPPRVIRIRRVLVKSGEKTFT
jgi:hypothetical protein